MITKLKKLPVLILIAVAALSWASATEQIDVTQSARSDGTVDIEIGAGQLRVIGWDRNEVKVSGTVGEDPDNFEISKEDGTISIEVELSEHGYDHSRREGHTDLEVYVPHDSRLEIEGISLTLNIVDVRGSISVEVVSGEIEVDADVEEVELSLVSGNITLVNKGKLVEGEFSSVSGNVDVKTDLEQDGSIDIETVSGEVTLRLPSAVCADFSVETFSGDIRNDFGPAAKKTSPYVPAKTLNFSTCDAEAEVNIECFSGLVRLVKE